MKRIAIIGATGAIGTAVLEQCIEHNVEAFVFIRPDSKRKDRIPEHPLIHMISCGMEELKSFESKMLPEIDVFYQFAWMGTHGADARNNMDVQIENIQYTMDAVRLAYRLKSKAFIFAGSQAEYGRVEGILRPDTPCKPENGYGMAKLCAEEMSRVECCKLGMRHITGRILSVYGPKDGENSMVSCAIRTCLRGENPAFTRGEQLWDYLYSGDAGEAFYLMGKSGKHNAVYVLGSGKIRPLKEYIEIICETANPQVVPEFGAVPYMEKQVMHLQADISELQRDTGFEPHTSFEEGIKRTIQWMKETTN